MGKWDEQERKHDRDNNGDWSIVDDDDDEITTECEEFCDDDKFVAVRIYTIFIWYDHYIGEVFKETERSDIPYDNPFIEIILYNDRKHNFCKEFVIYYDEGHKPITTAIHLGTYSLDEDLYYADRLEQYLNLRRYEIIRKYVLYNTLAVSKS